MVDRVEDQPVGTSIGEWVDVRKLHPWPQNPRVNASVVARVVASIRKFGWTSPILARTADAEIIAGHTRYQAALKLGMATVPVRWLDVDATQAHTIALADNKLGELATWDDAKLAEVLAELQTADAPLADAGFSDGEVDALIAAAAGVVPDPALAATDGGDQSAQVTGQYLVVVECSDEAAQLAALDRLTTDGYTCRALVS